MKLRFTADDFWEILLEVQSGDVTPAVASLLLSMPRPQRPQRVGTAGYPENWRFFCRKNPRIRGINGLNSQTLLRALQQRGDVAEEVLGLRRNHFCDACDAC